MTPVPAPVDAGCADPCTQLGALRCAPDGATEHCVRIGGCLTWATVGECEDGGACCRDASDLFETPSSAQVDWGFVTIEIACGDAGADPTPCGGTWRVDSQGVLTCPNASTVDLSVPELVAMKQLVLSAGVIDALDRGTGCSMAWGAGASVVVVLLADGYHAREVSTCGDWVGALRAHVQALDAAHCRGGA
jgi:hypothetical protein